MKRLRDLLIGFMTDFWMLPLACLLMHWHSRISERLGLFPPMNPEKVGKIVSALVLFLLVMFLVRLYTLAQYHDVYKTGLMRKKNERWNELSSWQQFVSLRVERWVLMIVFAIIMTAL
ncbi:hypothetical protein [Mangrovibacterium sp.]|uniref:hypothetical protein n=1 Tax=Mangrovibacterium sp. TaxID=1961364 RepID=UPI0035650562